MRESSKISLETIEKIATDAFSYDGNQFRRNRTGASWRLKRLIIYTLVKAFGFDRERIVEIYGKQAEDHFDTVVPEVEKMMKKGEKCEEYVSMMSFFSNLKDYMKQL